jgi:hypothetical protein
MTLALVAKNAVKSVQHNSPILLTGFAIGGVVSTVALAIRATPKALERIRFHEEEMGAETTAISKLRIVWPFYIPTAVVGASTIACIVGAQSINARRQAALVGAFAITEGAFQEYKDEVVEVLGKNKEQKVRDDIVQKQVTENPPPAELTIIGSGNVLCLDSYTGRYFESTMEKIRAAENAVNEMLINGEAYLSLNEFYGMLNLPYTVVGEQVGFSVENLLKIHFSTALTEDGRPCLAIEFRALPRQDYHSLQ